MGLIITLLIALLFAVVAFYIVDRIGLDAKTGQIVKAILAVLFLIWLFQEFIHPWGGYYVH